MRLQRSVSVLLVVGVIATVGGCASPGSTPSSGSAGPGPVVETSAASAAELTAGSIGELVSQAQSSAGTVRVVSRFPYPQGPVLVQTADVSAGDSPAELMARIVTKIGKDGRYGDEESRVIGSDVFRIDHLTAAISPDGSLWKRLDLADTDDPHVDDVASVLRLTDPARVAELYADVQRLDELGQSTVDGVTAHCYRAAVPPDALWTDPRDDLDPELQELVDENLPDTVPIEVCLDGRMLPVTVQLGAGSTVHFSRWGVPFETSAPPAAQVAVD